MNSDPHEDDGLTIIIKLIIIGSVALGALLLFIPLIALVAILLASFLEAVIEFRSLSFTPRRNAYLNVLFPITSIALIVLAVVSVGLGRIVALLSLSAILAGTRAWEYLGLRLKGLVITGLSIAVLGCLGLLFIAQSSGPAREVLTSLGAGSIVYELIFSAPWSALVLAGLIIYSSTLIHMLKYIRS